ncbi:MAG: bifunctional UDP-N-acetylglucosamine diphosphorylase/glucosamine-1-phosphate N-acetyltransferase GlmU [Clostridiaceae bacterium]|nr:bifunctional UDP-N-acetylglucosamine diphosphorylase/glucosamine-1-phosphate N-acetyltransferase GlmU [Clostridiaceae bacterium]
MEAFYAVILAAGAGTRMKSDRAKVIHELCGKPMVNWVIDAVKASGTENIIVVTGHQEDQVRACIKEKVEFVSQNEQLGTGHAVMQVKPLLQGKKGTCLILCGDTPLITSETIKQIVHEHNDNNRAMTVLTAIFEDPEGYGRIIRDHSGNVRGIVEHSDATSEQLRIKEINTGIYCFEIDYLLKSLENLSNQNDQNEYYLTDTLSIILENGGKVGTTTLGCTDEMMGINDRVQLAWAQKILNRRIIEKHMRNGVTFLNPDSCIVEHSVDIGRDTVIYPLTILEGNTKVGQNCIIGPNSKITDTLIGNNVTVLNSVTIESTIDDDTNVGPFAYLRPGNQIGKNVKIGDFVEVKKSVIGDHTKISHLAYIGDAEIGKNVNIGCGVVVVNYDGEKKHKTIVGDNSFVGCNVNLVSPVEVKANSFIAAGSTITEEVPEFSLAIARSRQTIIRDWVIRKGRLRGKKPEE